MSKCHAKVICSKSSIDRSVRQRNLSKFYHLIHVTCFACYFSIVITSAYLLWEACGREWSVWLCQQTPYSTWYSILYYTTRLNLLLALPQTVLYATGLLFANVFDDLDADDYPSPPGHIQQSMKICIRIVTRGDYHRLINSTLDHNLAVCRQVNNNLAFVFELLTEKPIELTDHLTRECVTQTIVPGNYKCENGTLFKVGLSRIDSLFHRYKKYTEWKFEIFEAIVKKSSTSLLRSI